MKNLIYLFICLGLLACQPNSKEAQSETTENTEDTNTDTNTSRQEAAQNVGNTLSIAYLKAILGLEAAQSGDDMVAVRQKAKLEMVRGSAKIAGVNQEVYFIFDENRKVLARMFYKTDENNVDYPERVEIMSPDIITPEGIKVGDAYSKLKAIYPALTLNGTAGTGWTFGVINKVFFRLTATNEGNSNMKIEPYDSIIFMGFNWE